MAVPQTTDLVIAIICILVVAITPCQAQGTGDSNVCTQQRTCGQCIVAPAACGWCMSTTFDDEEHDRCDTIDNLVAIGCGGPYIVNPDSQIQAIRNETLRNGDNSRDAIQLSPQEVSVTLRPNQPFTFDVQYRQAENYPVDLYFVMDLSYSMVAHRNKLAELSDKLAAALRNITNNYQHGFGSFIDKPVIPFITTEPARLLSPCNGCAPPYGFRNDLPLTRNTSNFKDSVTNSQISGNLDTIEGGFDAIMQAIVCKNEIGWRNASRKLLLYSTDNGFHQAMDGRLAGILTPNDGRCHLDSNRMYSESANQDYPSIGHISRVISENKVNLIVAIENSHQKLGVYEKLKPMIEGSAVSALESDNIVDLIKENYKKISGTVELKVTKPDDVFVTFRSKCGGNTVGDTTKCENIGIGQRVTFEATIQARECPADVADRDKYVEVGLVGLNENLQIRIKLMCDCECERDSFAGVGDVRPPDHNSTACNGTGTFNCGACSCNAGYYGDTCECGGSTVEALDQDSSTCKRMNNSAVCEGRGQCACGVCNCFPIRQDNLQLKYSGEFCQCNDYDCEKDMSGLVCGGPTKGRCQCGTCTCNPDYGGTGCGCLKSDQPCRTDDGNICHNRGHCQCGKCTQCEPPYYGDLCQDCPSCQGRCTPNGPCVQCAAFQTGQHNEAYCNANCTHVELVDEVDRDSDEIKYCTLTDEDGCDFFFTYEISGIKVQAQRTKLCPEPVNALAIGLGTLAGVVLIGIVLLIVWKVMITIYDKREMARFEKERAKAQWEKHGNPLYVVPTSTIQNPAFQGKPKEEHEAFQDDPDEIDTKPNPP